LPLVIFGAFGIAALKSPTSATDCAPVLCRCDVERYEAGNGVLSSFGLFETSEQADESKNLVTKWISDENFNSVIPNPPKITSGKVVAHSERVPALV
jgi:hypothetical protein